MAARYMKPISYRYSGNGQTDGPKFNAIGRTVMGIAEANNANFPSYVYQVNIKGITYRVQKTTNGDRIVYIDVPGTSGGCVYEPGFYFGNAAKTVRFNTVTEIFDQTSLLPEDVQLNNMYQAVENTTTLGKDYLYSSMFPADYFTYQCITDNSAYIGANRAILPNAEKNGFNHISYTFAEYGEPEAGSKPQASVNNKILYNDQDGFIEDTDIGVIAFPLSAEKGLLIKVAEDHATNDSELQLQVYIKSITPCAELDAGYYQPLEGEAELFASETIDIGEYVSPQGYGTIGVDSTGIFIGHVGVYQNIAWSKPIFTEEGIRIKGAFVFKQFVYVESSNPNFNTDYAQRNHRGYIYRVFELELNVTDNNLDITEVDSGCTLTEEFFNPSEPINTNSIRVYEGTEVSHSLQHTKQEPQNEYGYIQKETESSTTQHTKSTAQGGEITTAFSVQYPICVGYLLADINILTVSIMADIPIPLPSSETSYDSSGEYVHIYPNVLIGGSQSSAYYKQSQFAVTNGIITIKYEDSAGVILEEEIYNANSTRYESTNSSESSQSTLAGVSGNNIPYSETNITGSKTFNEFSNGAVTYTGINLICADPNNRTYAFQSMRLEYKGLWDMSMSINYSQAGEVTNTFPKERSVDIQVKHKIFMDGVLVFTEQYPPDIISETEMVTIGRYYQQPTPSDTTGWDFNTSGSTTGDCNVECTTETNSTATITTEHPGSSSSFDYLKEIGDLIQGANTPNLDKYIGFGYIASYLGLSDLSREYLSTPPSMLNSSIGDVDEYIKPSLNADIRTRYQRMDLGLRCSQVRTSGNSTGILVWAENEFTKLILKFMYYNEITGDYVNQIKTYDIHTATQLEQMGIELIDTDVVSSFYSI